MKIKWPVYFLFILLAPSLGAQTVEWGNQQKHKSRTNYTQVLGENGSGIFLVRSRLSEFRSDLIIEKYKTNLAPEISKDLPQPEGSRIERAIVVESGVLTFSSLKNQATNKIDLILTVFDNSLLQGSRLTVLSVDAAAIHHDRLFFIRASADKKNFAVMYITHGAEKNSSILNLHGYDASFNQKYSRRFALGYGAEDVFVTNVECDNQGNTFALLDFPREQKRKDKDSRNFFLYAYYPSGDNMLEYDIKRDSLFINEAGIVVNNYAKTVNVAGFYSDKPNNLCLGTFYYKLDIGSGVMDVKQFDPFERSFVGKVAGSMQNENSIQLSDLYIRKLVPNSDGGCTVIAEKYYESKQTYTTTINGMPQTSFKTIYNFDEIIIIARNGDGSLRFREFIKKTQSSVSDAGYYSSFVTILGNDRIGLVYNADVNTDSDVMLATISTKGILDHKVLIKSMSYYVTILPPESRQVSSNSAIISTLKDRRFCLMRLSF